MAVDSGNVALPGGQARAEARRRDPGPYTRRSMDLPFGLNPYENDPGAWGASLINNAELLLACLDVADARSVAEVGAYAGDLTRLLLLWAERSEAKVVAIDPMPQPELEQLERERRELDLIRETRLAAQPRSRALPHLQQMTRACNTFLEWSERVDREELKAPLRRLATAVDSEVDSLHGLDPRHILDDRPGSLAF